MKTRLGINEFLVGIDNECIKNIYAEQVLSNWCWAASTQMVLKSHCIYFSQHQLVEILTKGNLCYPNCPNNFFNVADLLNNVNINYCKIIAKAYIGLPNADYLISEIENENPVIVGLWENHSDIGHAVVLTNLIYKIGFNGLKYISKLYVLDPFPSDENKNRNGIKVYEGDYISKVINTFLIIKTQRFQQRNEFY